MPSLPRPLGRAAAAVLATATLCLTVVTITGTASADEAPAASTYSPLEACPVHVTPGQMSCFARAARPVSTTQARAAQARSLAESSAGATMTPAATTPVSGEYTPADFKAMYDLPSFSATPTIGIVDVGHNPQAVANLDYYRSSFDLPPCTSANGCFTEVNQAGATTGLPAEDADWDSEIDLDIQMVSGICPSCHILLVDATSSWSSDLDPAISTATRLGAQYVSMSWGSPEFPGEATDDAAYLSEPNVTYVASTGDWGYSAGTMWPAASANVIAAGGTTVTRRAATGTPSDFTMTTWDGTGSGCSTYEPRPTSQSTIPALANACGGRAQSDVSALADPATGALIRTGGDWWLMGGTSASAPAIAAMYAMAGNHTDDDSIYGNYLAAPSRFRDVTSGTTLDCPSGNLLCTAKAGWDGPTGLGAPLGLGGLSATTPVTSPVTLKPHNPGNVTATRDRSARWNVTYSGTKPPSGITYSARGLPAGMRLSGGYVTGIPTHTGSGTATITVRPAGGTTSAFKAGSTSFGWRVIVHAIVRTGTVRVAGTLRRGRTVSATVGTFRQDSTRGTVLHPRLTYAWYVGGKRVAGAYRTLRLQNAWHRKRVQFKVTASGPGLVTRTFTSPRSATIR